MPVIHGPGMALVSRGAVCLDRCDSDPLFHIGAPRVSAMRHPMAVTSRRFATIGTRRSGRRTASPRHAFAAVDRFVRRPREICRKHPKQSNTAW